MCYRTWRKTLQRIEDRYLDGLSIDQTVRMHQFPGIEKYILQSTCYAQNTMVNPKDGLLYEILLFSHPKKIAQDG